MAIDQEERKPTKADRQNNKKLLIIVGVVLGALILLSIAGTVAAGYFFNKTVETGFNAATGGKMDIDNDKVTFEGEDGKSTFESSAEIPEGFPSAVPVYEGAEVTNSSSSTVSGEGTIYSVTLTSKDSPDKMADFYKKAFSDNGWKTANTINNSDMASVSANHAAKELYGQAIVSFDRDGVTTLQLSAKTNDQAN